MPHTRLILIKGIAVFGWFLTAFLAVYPGTDLYAQGVNYIAMIPPLHDRRNGSGRSSTVQLTHQRLVISLYRNAAVVYSEGDFVNRGEEPYTVEMALPSTGHREGSGALDARVSNGILGVELWVEGERASPQMVTDGDGDWYVINTTFQPRDVKKIKSLFWLETSLADIDSVPGLDTFRISGGRRGCVIDLSHAGGWYDVIQAVDITVLLKEGLSADGPAFSAEPKTYTVTDSAIEWKFRNIEPSENDDISILYSVPDEAGTPLNTMAVLARYVVTRGYDETREIVRILDDGIR